MADDFGRRTPISQEVIENIDEVARANANRVINHELQYLEIIEHRIRFGQATPWGRRNSVFQDRKKTILCSSAVILLLFVIIFYIYSSSLTDKKSQSIVIIDENDNSCECSTDIFEKKFGIYKDEQIFSLLIDHESNIDQMIFEESIDNSTCLLYDAFSYLKTKLCCLTSMIINRTPIQ